VDFLQKHQEHGHAESEGKRENGFVDACLAEVLLGEQGLVEELLRCKEGDSECN